MNDEQKPGKELVPITPAGTVQSENTVGRNLAGRDVFDVQGDYINVEAPAAKETKLSQLYRRLKDEAVEDQQLSEYIDQLAIFTRIVSDEHVVGLDGKLTAASRSDQLEMAVHLKERVYAQIRENIFSRTFQTIYATLMAKVWEEFVTHVRPAIARSAPRTEVDALISEHVIKPVAAELDDCADYHGVATTDVRGMLYFLTGNCHLLWH